MNDNDIATPSRSLYSSNGLTDSEVRVITKAASALPGRWFAVETVEDVGEPGSAGRQAVFKQINGPPIGSFTLSREGADLDDEGLVVLLDNGRGDLPDDLGYFPSVTQAVAAVGDHVRATLASWGVQPV